MATLPTSSNPPPGSATGYSSSVNTNLGLLRQNDQTLEDRIELGNNLFIGTGILANSYTPPLLSVGTGLSVNVAAHSLILGYFDTVGSAVISVPNDTATVYLWEKQDRTYTATTSSTNPGTLSNPAIALGTCHTAAGVVSTVVETFNLVYPLSSDNPPTTEIFGPTRSSPYTKVWDATFSTRAGGTACNAIVVSQDVDATKGYTVTRGNGGNVTLHPDFISFSAPRTFSIATGERPVDNGTTVREDIVITYTPL